MALPATCSESSTTCASTPGRSGRKPWRRCWAGDAGAVRAQAYDGCGAA
jgi:hypothetical protein